MHILADSRCTYLCRHTQQRLAQVDFKLDVGYLFSEDMPGGPVASSDIPEDLQQRIAQPETAAAHA